MFGEDVVHVVEFGFGVVLRFAVVTGVSCNQSSRENLRVNCFTRECCNSVQAALVSQVTCNNNHTLSISCGSLVYWLGRRKKVASWTPAVALPGNLGQLSLEG